ncbi:hypothetical protein ESW18_20215 [Algoriphagus ratkowskyi]|uniref:Phage shock protein B n=1 Tax=Algoriphagus ratkowskyi TaxID=57028 RepID=A0ABY3HJI5_9BACT|nr:hypothetical protein ESW18_20215 [Algoriphagus ratkowskyi]
MSGTELLLSLAGGMIMLLLSVIAYFLKLLIQDSRQMNTELSKLKELFIRLEAEQKLMKTLLQRTRSPPSRFVSRKDGSI